MKKLLLAAAMTAGLAVGVAPAFAQSAATSQPGLTDSGNQNDGSVQAQNFAPSQTNGVQSGMSGATVPSQATTTRNPAWSQSNPWAYELPNG